MQLKIYQETAIDDLLEKAKRLLSYSGNKKLVFKSPTGSGKTIMMAEFLKQLVDDREIKNPLAFIWTAPRQLHTQSRQKLDDYFEASKALECSCFEDLDDKKIGQNEILFFNWESINRADNIYIRDNEQDFNLSKVLEKTKEEGREVILIIDEAHHHATTDISLGLIQMIGPKLTIEVSATPVLAGDLSVDVMLDDVKRDGMIKKAVLLDDGFKNIKENGRIKSGLSGGSEELVIDSAIRRRKELVEAYGKEKAEINPLILIQLPNRVGGLEDEMREKIEKILKGKYKISTENGNNKLAIWLSGEHINKEDVERSDSQVEVLIFKEAIALGWDCPRAQILVLFREWHSPVFSIQTVGRIMRMPEPDRGHYKADILNYGYVYTNLDNIEIQEDMAKDYITIYTSNRKFDPKLNLLSCYSKRHREKTRLSPLFIDVFLKEAKKYELKKKINIKDKKVSLKIISDQKAENIDALIGTKFIGDKSIKGSTGDFQKLFDYYVRNNLTPFYPEDRSVGRVKESIYKFFEENFKMKRGIGEDDAIKVVLGEKNSQHFINVIDKAKEEYQRESAKRDPELEFEENWNIKPILTFSSDYVKKDFKKSIMEPFYSNESWKSEENFIDYLEKSSDVDWWFKNGDRDATFFAVPYLDNGPKPFYVDFIIKMKNGRVGLFDPHGIHLADFPTKSDGLRKYIEIENKKGKKLFGGMVANTDSQNYKGRWVYFDKPSKEFNKDKFDNWEDLEL